MRVPGVKRLLLGRALSSHSMEHQLLPKYLALPVFSSDPLSSVAYATEEMMLVLVAAGAGALAAMVPIGLAIAALLAIVVTSYRQTVKAYPRGGGSYIVARENLGAVTRWPTSALFVRTTWSRCTWGHRKTSRTWPAGGGPWRPGLARSSNFRALSTGPSARSGPWFEPFGRDRTTS